MKTELSKSQRSIALLIAMLGYCVDCGKDINRMSATSHVKKFHKEDKGTTMKTKSKRSKRTVVSDSA